MDGCSEDELEKDGGSDFVEHAMALGQGLLDRLVLPARCWETWRGLRHFDDVCWCVVRAMGLVLGHPLAVMVASD
jgi:hypothetical protein